MNTVFVEPFDQRFGIIFVPLEQWLSELVQCHLNLSGCNVCLGQPVHLVECASLGPRARGAGVDANAYQCLALAHTMLLPDPLNHALVVDGPAHHSSEVLQGLHGHGGHCRHLGPDSGLKT